MGKQMEPLSCFFEERYAEECRQLAELANQQLNLEKNASKGAFEDLCDFRDLIGFLKDEVDELRREVVEILICCTYCWEEYEQEKREINYQRAREEIGDVAAVLVGLVAKLNKIERDEK